MNKKYIKTIAWGTAGVAVVTLIGTSDVMADVLEIVRPIDAKSKDIQNLIKYAFGSIAGAALAFYIFRGVLSEDNRKKTEMFVKAGWIFGGSVALASLAKILTWFGVTGI